MLYPFMHLFIHVIGERFRVKVRLPEWYTDETIAKFLLK